jgi:hypothetical protein
MFSSRIKETLMKSPYSKTNPLQSINFDSCSKRMSFAKECEKSKDHITGLGLAHFGKNFNDWPL